MNGGQAACGTEISADTTLDADPVCEQEPALVIVADGVTLDLGGNSVQGGAGVVAAAVAVAVLPLRDRLQRLVSRLLYGDRGQPYEALRRLADRTHDASTLDTVLAELASTVAASLRVPWVRVEAEGHAAEVGLLPDRSVASSADLRSGGTEVGTISVAAGPGRNLRAEDEALLADLARHGGIAVQAIALAEAVVASRQRLVVAREEERRQLRRDLHDQLGPTMASIAMQLSAVRGMLSSDAEGLGSHLSRLENAARTALADVRRLAREVRPPALWRSVTTVVA